MNFLDLVGGPNIAEHWKQNKSEHEMGVYTTCCQYVRKNSQNIFRIHFTFPSLLIRSFLSYFDSSFLLLILLLLYCSPSYLRIRISIFLHFYVQFCSFSLSSSPDNRPNPKPYYTSVPFHNKAIHNE